MAYNALRCIETDYPALIALAKMMGVLDANGNPAHDGIEWDYIGYKQLDNGEILKDGNGIPYVHVNVITPFSVGQAAAEAAASNPAIAAALGDPSRFFVTNPDGSAKDPEFPMRVFL